MNIQCLMPRMKHRVSLLVSYPRMYALQIDYSLYNPIAVRTIEVYVRECPDVYVLRKTRKNGSDTIPNESISVQQNKEFNILCLQTLVTSLSYP